MHERPLDCCPPRPDQPVLRSSKLAPRVTGNRADRVGSARLPGGGSNTFGDMQAAIIIAHVKWLPTGAVLGCHDDISRGGRARGPAATAHGWLTARCHIHGDLAGRGINRAVVAAVVDVTRLHRRLSFAPHGRASRFVACKRNAPMTARVTAAPSASLAIWGGRVRDPTRSLTANGSLLARRICQHCMRAILSLGPMLWTFPK